MMCRKSLNLSLKGRRRWRILLIKNMAVKAGAPVTTLEPVHAMDELMLEGNHEHVVDCSNSTMAAAHRTVSCL